MPQFNGTGPEGKGSQTGRGAGKCNPTQTNMNQPRNGMGFAGALFGGLGRMRRMRLFGGQRGGGRRDGRGRGRGGR